MIEKEKVELNPCIDYSPEGELIYVIRRTR